VKVKRWPALLVVAAVIIAAMVLRAALKAAEVEMAEVARGDLVAELAATGVVEGYQGGVGPEVPGRVLEVLAEEGDEVAAGELLGRLEAVQAEAGVREREAAAGVAAAQAARATAQLAQERAASGARIGGAKAALGMATARLKDLEAGARPQEIERAREAVSAAEADAELAAADHARAKELFEKGAVSRADLDRASARLRSVDAGLRSARQELELLEEGARAEQIAGARSEVAAAQAELDSAQAMAGQVEVMERSLAAAKAGEAQAAAALASARRVLAETEIRAPISGRVSRRYVDVGDLAGPGQPAFLITQPEGIWVAAEVDEEDLALVHKGQRVTVTAEALAEPIEGTVVEVGAAAFPRGLQQTRAKIVRCRVRLEENSEVLRPGMEVDVNGSRTLAENVLLMPLEALVELDGKHFAWVARSNRAHRAPIEIGRRSFQQVEVTSGLNAGDRVIVSGSAGLTEGARVKGKG